MTLLLVFAFLAGIATVLSPCVLPILPALLAGSTAKGTMRPLGIIIGLITSFTVFTLTLTAIVHATGVSPNSLRYIAIGLLFLFGLVLLFPKLSDYFSEITSPFASFGLTLQGTGKGSGFFSGILFGAALGLLWTPCAGPILAAITTVVATRSIDFFTVLITLAYSIGAGIPLFLIAFGGNSILNSSKFLSQHAEAIRRVFGIVTILTALAIALHLDVAFQTKIADVLPAFKFEDNSAVQQALQDLQGEQGDLDESLEIKGITHWINTPPLTLGQLKGKTVLIDFWTYSCINCLRTLPYLKKWYADYKDQGLVIIGVHTPEFEFEKDPANVKDAVKRLGILYPVAQDNNFQTWKAFHNHYWPAHYLIDAKGNLRMMHFGEGEYVKTENAIRQLLGLSKMTAKEVSTTPRPLSQETYLGLARGNQYISAIEPKAGSSHYDYKGHLSSGQVGLKGDWKMEQEFITSESNESFLNYHFLAKQVYLVLTGSSNDPIQVLLDGKPYGEIKVNGAMKYDVVNTSYGQHQLSLKVPRGISAYAFTFGDE